MPVFGGTPQKPVEDKRIPGVKKIIAVGAGKGGVGKSTVAVNIAVALGLLGKKVGLLDSDIYGPSIPHLFGLHNAHPNLAASNKIDPVSKFGVSAMSLGFLIEEGSAVIWRGPMLFKAITQFLHDVSWGELDFLIVDLPPGTGDVQLTLSQKSSIDGAIIVSTPQDTSLIDVKRCVDMFDKVKTPILGIVENMTGLICEKCGHENHLFKQGSLHAYAADHKLALLGSIPFNPALGVFAEEGKPLMAIEDEKVKAGVDYQAFMKIAKSLI